MTEKEKMLAGELYYGNEDEQLVQGRVDAKKLCYCYNQLDPSDKVEKEEIIHKLFGKTGEQFWIEQPILCDYGYNIQIGENFYSNYHLTILDGNTVKFGNDVLVGPNCVFTTAGHPLEVEKRKQGLEFTKPIVIGNNVWIGANVVVLPGVTIGNNSVIGAGSIVTKDIPQNVVAVGNPCRIIKKI